MSSSFGGSRRRTARRWLALTAAVVGLALAAPEASAAPPTQARGNFVFGSQAVARLGTRLPDVAKNRRMSAETLRTRLLNDPTLGVDANLDLAYFDPAAPGGVATASASSSAVGAAPDTSGPQFQLASLPGADKTVYLDFDGNTTVGTSWNTAYGLASIENPPYNTDGDPSSFSASELANITFAWQVMAEDFAPWNVNVTTTDPGTEALRKSGADDTKWGIRVVFTADTFANCGCGGHAYVGSFDDTADEPTFVYNTGANGIAEAGSHEVGHTMNLAHDGLTNGTTYYSGHGTGETGWAPIMGSSYYRNLAQWSRQSYTGANNNGADANYNSGPDDLAIIGSLTNGNGFGLRPDDHGNTAATATPLAGTSPTTPGLIGTTNDVDAFSFQTSGAPISFTVAVPTTARVANLDASLTIRNTSGNVVATSNAPLGLSTSWSGSLPAGSYTAFVDGVGAGNPLASPPTGYTDYASIGHYELRATLDSPPDPTPPAAPTGLTAVLSGGSVDLSWDANTESDLAGYAVKRAASPAGPFTTIATLGAGTRSTTDTAPAAGTNVYVVTATDTSGNESAASESATVDAPTPDPFTVASSSVAVAGTVVGTYQATQRADGVSQSITEVDSAGRLSRRYDTLEHQWRIPASTGQQSLHIVATSTDAGDADSGFLFEWSRDGSRWTPLATFSGSLDSSFPLGSPTGDLLVRVVDTDSTAGQRRYDSVSVDLLRIDGGPVVAPTNVVLSTLTAGTKSGSNRRSFGTVSVGVTDNLGNPVSGAQVSVSFSGAFTDKPTLTTNASGEASYVTTSSVRSPSFTACVTDMTAGSLTYTGGAQCRTVG